MTNITITIEGDKDRVKVTLDACGILWANDISMGHVRDSGAELAEIASDLNSMMNKTENQLTLDLMEEVNKIQKFLLNVISLWEDSYKLDPRYTVDSKLS